MNRSVLLALSCAAFPAAAETIAFQGARLIDGTGRARQENSLVVVEGDRIVSVGTAGKAAVPKGARVVDLRGRTMVPGFINGHGHVGLVVDGQNRADGYTRENILPQLQQYEQYGVTSVLALGLNRDLGYAIRDDQRRGAFPGASLFLAGRGIGAPDGAPPVPVAADQVYRPQTPEEATRTRRSP